MTASICANVRCAYNRPTPSKGAGAPCIYIVEDGEQRRVDRHLYRDRDGNREFFLCDVCHGAVQMVVGSASGQRLTGELLD